MKILHIDDDKEITEGFSGFLDLKNYDYTSINDGKEAVSAICDGNFDIILLDLHMPNFNGFDIIDEIQKKGKIGNNIIVLTASSLETNEKEKLAKMGINSILYKPISINKILAEIQKKNSELIA